MMVRKVVEKDAAKRQTATDKSKLKLKKPDTVGSRIAKLRNDAAMTQQQLGDKTERGRSAIAQWERNDSEPDTEMFELLGDIFDVRPAYIAFGDTTEPTVVMPEPDVMGFVIVDELTFADKVTETASAAKWVLPVQWLRSEMQAVRMDTLFMHKVDAASGPYEYGDRVVIDRAATRVSPPGHFLIWDGVGPIVAHVSAVPGGAARKPMARVSGPTGDFETEVEKLQVIGKVRGVFKKA